MVVENDHRGENKMRLLLTTIVGLVVVFFASSCAFTPTFEPRTLEGARCKQQCAISMASCDGSSYTCDKASYQCIKSCIDIEGFSVESPN